MVKRTTLLISILSLLGLVLSACAPAVGTDSSAEPAVDTQSTDSSSAAEADATRPVVVDDLPTSTADPYGEYEIVTLLPRDAIPAVFDPKFLSNEDANQFYEPDELVIGVAFEGEARAYSIPYLSSREIVNDEIGDIKFAVTW